MLPLDMTLAHLRFLDARNGPRIDTTGLFTFGVDIDAACG